MKSITIRPYCTYIPLITIPKSVASTFTQATMEGAQQALLKELGGLLGFEDGAEDVLDHLLTIDSSEVNRYSHDVTFAENFSLGRLC